jgi:hypothetical protein
MTSPALDAFRIEIASLELSQKAKDDLKQQAEVFYIASVKEAATHVERHLDAAIIDNPLEKVRLDNANLALSIHEGLEA